MTFQIDEEGRMIFTIMQTKNSRVFIEKNKDGTLELIVCELDEEFYPPGYCNYGRWESSSVILTDDHLRKFGTFISAYLG